MRFRLIALLLTPALLTQCHSFGNKSIREIAADIDARDAADADTGGPSRQSGSSVFVIDLVTTLRLAGAENLDVRLRQAEAAAAKARADAATLSILPDLSAGGSYVRQRGVIQDVAGAPLTINRVSQTVGFGTGASGAGTYAVPGASLNFHIGNAVFGMLSAKQNRRAADAAAAAQRNQVLAEAAAAYYELVRAKSRVAIASEIVNAAGGLANATSAFAESGQGLPADAASAKATQLLRKREQARAANAYRQSALKLVRLLHLPGDTQLVPATTTVRPLDLAPKGRSNAEMVAQALEHRPEMAQYRAEVEGAIARFRHARSEAFLPAVGVGYSAGNFGAGFGGRPDQRDERNEITALIYWKLDNLGFGNRANQQAREAELEQARLKEERIVDRITEEVLAASSDITSLKQEIVVSREAVTHAQKSYKLTTQRLNEAQGLPIEALQSIQILADTRQAEIDSIIDHNIAQHQLLAALGELGGE
jgi:outer membrane protein TolC